MPKTKNIKERKYGNTCKSGRTTNSLCRNCGFKMRGPHHDNGAHHKNGRDGMCNIGK